MKAYQWLMSLATAALLLGWGSISQRPRIGDSLALDLIIRCALCGYASLLYWGIGRGLRRIPTTVMEARPGTRKTFASLVATIVRAIIAGLLLWFLTKYLLAIFIVEFPVALAGIIGMANGVLGSGLTFARYFLLPDPEAESGASVPP